MGYKKGGTLPIIELPPHHHEIPPDAIDISKYINPLPHVLMLTAIVVSVATFGVALAIALKIYKEYNTLEEDEIRMRIRER